MPWIQAILEVPSDQVSELEDLLMAIGAQAVTMGDATDQPIYEPKIGTTPLWSKVTLVALFDAEQPLEFQIRQLAELYKTEYEQDFPNYKIELVEDKDWVREWMDTFKPMPFGKRLWICPSWLEPEDPDAINLNLDPGLAFGTGTHPTTAMCLKWLDSADVEGKNIFDFGCGSGILGIAAMLLGGKSLVGIDIDPQAISASYDNSERNALDKDMISFHLPEDAPKVKTEIVLANILAGPLVELKDSILSYLLPDGLLVLSGILASQAQDVAKAYEDECNIISIEEDDGWVRIYAQRKA
jgi:ribosomal protein L11 methyltransferase